MNPNQLEEFLTGANGALDQIHKLDEHCLTHVIMIRKIAVHCMDSINPHVGFSMLEFISVLLDRCRGSVLRKIGFELFGTFVDVVDVRLGINVRTIVMIVVAI